jgi:hypothetical protein
MRLFGLAGINAVNRTKEIGIRKVLGAEMSSIFILLNKQYVMAVADCFCVGCAIVMVCDEQVAREFQILHRDQLGITCTKYIGRIGDCDSNGKLSRV